MVLKQLLDARTIRVDINHLDKWSAIERLADLVVGSEKAADREALLTAIMDREKQGSTGIGHGIAIPHARTGGVREVVVALGISAPGMDFDSPDGEPCYLIFLIAAPPSESTKYLEALAAVATLGEHPDQVAELRAAGSVDEVLRFLKTHRRRNE